MRKHGSWRNLCGKGFLFSGELVKNHKLILQHFILVNYQGTWQQNFDKCSSLGMQPIWFKNAAEMQCLAKEMADWTLNWNYWTGGIQQDSWGMWGWCSAQGVAPFTDDGLRWAAGEPDNFKKSEGCLQLRVLKNTTGLAIFDKGCNAKYALACQVGSHSLLRRTDIILISFHIRTN